MVRSKGVSIRGDRGKKECEQFFIGRCIWNTVPCFLLFQARSAYYVHETEEIYTATKPNLAKITKEPSATYQIRLQWSQRGTKVNRPHPAAFTTMVRKHKYPVAFTTMDQKQIR